MITSLFHTGIYVPLYNALIALVSIVPTADVGLAIVVLTVVVRIILYPLAQKAVQGQKDMKRIAPEVTRIRDQYKDDKQGETRAILALYKANNINPFASFAVVLIQLPILLGLYFVFARGGLPMVHTELLYSFVHVPMHINMHFLGLWDMGTNHNIIFALSATATQFWYTRLSMGPRGVKTATEASLSDDMARSFDVQARFVLPIIIGVVGYQFVAAAALYYTTSNLCMVLQEYISPKR